MRIGIDCRSLQEPEPSGVSAYTRETLRALVRLPEAAKHQFVCFVNGFGLRRDNAMMQQLGTIAPQSNVEWRVRRWPNKILTTSEVFFGEPRLRWMFGDVDVAFIPNLQFFSHVDRAIPFVLTVHDLSFEHYPDCLDFKGRLRHKLVRPREAAYSARKIITVSEYTKQDVVETYGISADKIRVVYPGVAVGPVTGKQSSTPLQAPARRRDAVATSEAPFPVPPAAAQGTRLYRPRAGTPSEGGELRELRSGGSQPYIVFISTVEPRKNVATLLQAMYRVREQDPQVKLVIIGRQGWRSAELIRRIQKIPFVHYLGYADEATKHSVLAGAKAFVYPSLYEGFGFPPLEAQAAGVPVIAGSHSSLPEVVGNCALLVDVLDVDSVARGINHVLSDDALRQRLITAGYANVHRFTWENSARQVLETLTGCIMGA